MVLLQWSRLVAVKFKAEARHNRVDLWENFVFMELMKKSGVDEDFSQFYFWRTHTGQEIDIIKESNGRLNAIEFKWSGSASVPGLWKATYPEATFTVINNENYLEMFLQ